MSQDNPWIPIEDASLTYERRYEVTFLDGSVDVRPGRMIDKSLVLAVKEYKPEPYVPPLKVRRVFYADKSCLQTSLPVTLYATPHKGSVKLVEAFPGDPELGVVAEVREAIKTTIRLATPTSSEDRTLLQELRLWVERLGQ